MAGWGYGEALYGIIGRKPGEHVIQNSLPILFAVSVPECPRKADGSRNYDRRHACYYCGKDTQAFRKLSWR
jgi:hypothetical protein